MCVFFTMNVYKVTNAHMAKMEKLKPTGLSRQNEWVNKSKWSYLYSYWIQFRQSLDPVHMDCLQGHMYTLLLPSLLNISVECSKRQFTSEKGMSLHLASCLFVALEAVEPASHTEWLSKKWSRPLVGGLHMFVLWVSIDQSSHVVYEPAPQVLFKVCRCAMPTDDIGLSLSFTLRRAQHTRWKLAQRSITAQSLKNR